MPKSKPIIDDVLEIKLKKLFRLAKTWNRFLVLEILSDGIPRKKKEVIQEFQAKEKALRQTVYASMESLEKDELIFVDSTTGLVSLEFAISLTSDELTLVRFLNKEGGRSLSRISEIWDLDVIHTQLIIDHLIEIGKVRRVEKTSAHIEKPYEVFDLVK